MGYSSKGIAAAAQRKKLVEVMEWAERAYATAKDERTKATVLDVIVQAWIDIKEGKI